MRYFMALLFIVALSNTIFAQDDRVKKLEKEVEELKKMMEEQNKLHTEQIKKLQEQIQELKERKEPEVVYPTPKSKEQSSQLQQSLSVLNPRITAFGNMIGNFSDKRQFGPDGDRISNRFFLRSAELDIRAAVDPFADAVSIIPLEQKADNEFEATVEEAYIWLKKIPGVDQMPLGLKLQLGKFRPTFGFLNKVHMHDLPWTTVPLPVARYLGQESLGRFGEGGFSSVGANAEFFLPSIPKDAAITADLAIVNGGQARIAENNASNNLAFIERLGWFYSPSDTTDLSFGLSDYYGKNDADGKLSSNLFGVDFMYKWKPLEQGEWKSFIFGGELFKGTIQSDIVKGNINPLGYYLYAQYQFDKPWYLGIRFDSAHRDITSANLNEKVIAAYISYYTTEFLRFRLGVEKHFSNIEPDSNSILFEINWVFGSHPTEPYWVNK